MQNYKTVDELANELDISPRHIQYLCKNGKINGVIKRQGKWFIPVEAIIPLKNTKSDADKFKFVGTKQMIFDNSIELFANSGFESISIKDIANSAGIKHSAFYNHFKSKQDILDTIYEYFCYYYLQNRLSIEDIEQILQQETLVNIMISIRNEFSGDYKQKMFDIIKIIFQRYLIDIKARNILSSLMIKEEIQYVESVFNKAVEIGRLAPMDTHAIAIFIISVRLYTLHNRIINPSIENMTRIVEEELKQYKYAAKLLVDLKPLGKNTK